MIHYHGTPMWPQTDMAKAFKAKHAMVSFAHRDQMEVAAELCQSVVLDNGAFSAWKAQKSYDFAGYTEWAATWVRHPCVDWCVIPDVIDGDEKDNDALLRDWPLEKDVSVPVYHMHESLDRAFDLAFSYPRVALGSSGEYATVGNDKWWRRMDEVLSVMCDGEGLPLCKLHGLRMLDPVVYSHMPLSSADSCNVARNVGIDKSWAGRYSPRSRFMRALILMERIEGHASASRWSRRSAGVSKHDELLG